MSRVASIVALALALGLVAGCGGGRGEPALDAGVDAFGDVPDAAPDAALEPPACLVPPASPSAAPCRECLVNPPLTASSSRCAEAVCAFDPSCCQTGWTERCTEVADRACPDLDCVNAITMGGYGAISYARHDGDGFDGTVWASSAESNMLSVAWADYDDDGDADLAIAGTCNARVLRNDGGSGATLELVEVLRYTPFPDDCVSGNQALFGQRVRWADMDRDSDLDLVVGGGGLGAGVAFWVPYQAGRFVRASEDVVPIGAREVSDLVVVDVDGDLRMDAIVTFRNAPARLFRNTVAGFVEDAWQGELSSALTIELCDLVGDVRPEIVMVGYASNVAYRLTGGGVGSTLFPLGFPVPSSIDVACGDLDGDADGKEEAAFLLSEGLVRIVDGDDGLVWDSQLDATPPYAQISFGIDAGDLDHDGDVDLVVSGGASPNAPFDMMWNTGGDGPLDFTPETLIDLTPDAHTARAEMTWLAF